jgi:PIN domain nuclease of toxin-antitoxin system
MNALATFRPARISTKRLVAAVDNLALINAEILRLEAEADKHKALLKAAGADEICGTLHRAVIVTSTTARLDTKLVRQHLTPASIDACTVESTSTKVCLYDL